MKVNRLTVLNLDLRLDSMLGKSEPKIFSQMVVKDGDVSCYNPYKEKTPTKQIPVKEIVWKQI